MFDQYFTRWNLRRWRLICEQRRCHLRPIHADVDVSAARHFELFKSWNRTDSGNNLFRDLPWSLAQFAGQFKSKWKRVLAKFDFGWLLHDNIRSLQAVSPQQECPQMFDQSPFQKSIQGCPLTN